MHFMLPERIRTAQFVEVIDDVKSVNVSGALTSGVVVV